MSATEVVQRYHEAFGRGDVQEARSLLADDLYFKGPIDEFHSADDYLASLGKLAQIVTGTDVQKVVGDDEDVVTIYDPRVRRSARPLRAEAASPPAVAATR